MVFLRRWFMTYRKQLINFGNYTNQRNKLNPLKLRTAMAIYVVIQLFITLFVFKNAVQPLNCVWYVALMALGCLGIGKAYYRGKQFEPFGRFLFESVFLFVISCSFFEGMAVIAYYETLFVPFVVFILLAFGSLSWNMRYTKKKIEQDAVLDSDENKKQAPNISTFTFPLLGVAAHRICKRLLPQKTQTVIFMFGCAFLLFVLLYFCCLYFLLFKGLQFAEEDSNTGTEKYSRQRKTVP